MLRLDLIRVWPNTLAHETIGHGSKSRESQSPVKQTKMGGAPTQKWYHLVLTHGRMTFRVYFTFVQIKLYMFEDVGWL